MTTSPMITIPARRGKAAFLRRDQHIKVINTHGQQVIDTWAFNQSDLTEFMSMEHSRTALGRIMARTGNCMVTNHRRPILTRAPEPRAAPASRGEAVPRALADQVGFELGNRGKDAEENPPLSFGLHNLNTKHPYLAERGLEEETIKYFGLGYCSRGLMRGSNSGVITRPSSSL